MRKMEEFKEEREKEGDTQSLYAMQNKIKNEAGKIG